MQNMEIVQAAAAKRNSRLASIRLSLKGMPLHRQTSKCQLQNYEAINKFESQIKEAASNFSQTQASECQQMVARDSEAFYAKYDLMEKLGQGCNACVYKCQEKLTGKLYAVKKTKLEDEQVEEAKETFFNIKALQHPQISFYKAFYYDSQQRVSFIVMEYCPYANLSECHIQSEQMLKQIIRQLVPVIQYLHQNNICHRDIKPQNILYDPQSKQLKVIDFGISKKTTKLGQKRDMLTIIGSNCYLAPQIYLGGGYDQRVDLWCLGIAIFKLITGQTPFESEYKAQSVKKIIKGELRFDSWVWETYSQEAKDFVIRLLKEKSARMTVKQCKQHCWLAQ